jgi:cell division protein FtsN
MNLQRGGFAVGLIVGLLIGLVLALGVALYVTKVPAPFVNKVPQRTAEQDTAEAERNKNWDPNAPLGGKAPARAASSGTQPLAAPKAAAAPAAAQATGTAESSTAPAAAAPKSSKSGVDPFMYFAQAGAYTRPEDAEAQRAKLALLGVDTKLSEREQSGRTIFRVRAGPFQTRAEAEGMLERLQAANVDSALVRVERQ